MIPLVPVGFAHLEQMDTSLNPAILALWPSGTVLEVKEWRDACGPKERELAHLADRVLTLHRVATSLSLLCFRAVGYDCENRGETIEGFRNMVQRLGRYRRRADGLLETDPVAAAEEYYSALVQLRPWCSTPLLFRREDAFALGIAQLGCWAGLASALLILEQYETAGLCARIAREMKYAEPAARIRAKTILRAVSAREP